MSEAYCARCQRLIEHKVLAPRSRYRGEIRLECTICKTVHQHTAISKIIDARHGKDLLSVGMLGEVSD